MYGVVVLCVLVTGRIKKDREKERRNNILTFAREEFRGKKLKENGIWGRKDEQMV